MSARPFTPDRVETLENGRTRTHMTMKRVCNGCGEYVGDVSDAEMGCAIDGRALPDVRGECDNCRPVTEAEAAGCRTWQLTPQNICAVDDAIDSYNVFAKGYWQEVDGKLQVVGLRVGSGRERVVAFWGDWIIRHPDGHFTTHPAPTAPEEGSR